MSKASRHLKDHLLRINGKGYKAYKDIKGAYAFPGFWLSIDHVQGDPFCISLKGKGPCGPTRFRF